MADCKIAEIVPVIQLDDIKDNRYHMCLAHLVAQDSMEAWQYTEFYRSMSDEGKYVIMDNGAAEDSQLDRVSLVRQYEKVHPSEIVIPDTINNLSDTLSKMYSWLAVFSGLPYRFMAVPQGANFDEWKACAYVMMHERRIHTIGVTKFLNSTTQDVTIRYQAVRYLNDVANELGRHDMEYHLLGCNEGPHMVGKIMSENDHVRGCDSAFAYIATKSGVHIETYTQRPCGYIDFLCDKYLDGFADNAASFERICGVYDNTSGDGKEWKWPDLKTVLK